MARSVVGSESSVPGLADLRLDPHPANRGTARGRTQLAHSLTAYGAGRSILVDRHGTVIAGNKTLAVAQAQAVPVRVVQTQGEALIAVQRLDLDLATDTAARQLAIADNRVAEVGLAWDEDVLRALAAEGVELAPFWTPEEWASLIGDAAVDARADAVVAPAASDLPRGALFALGRHRVLCGDATDGADVARVLDGATPRLMATDPPYGVSYDPAWRAALLPQGGTAIGDVPYDDRVDWSAAYAHFPGSVAYVWHAGIHAGTAAAALTTSGFAIRAQIIWVKQHFALSRGHYHWQHEPCWYAVREGQPAHWCGGRTQSTVWEVPNLNPHGGTRDGANAVTGHGTQKPVALFVRPLQHHTVAGEAVYDPFLGSGTALLAAETTGRVCYGLDIDARYVQAAVTRWETFTGQRATRLG
jgi:DNA modification methylase